MIATSNSPRRLHIRLQPRSIRHFFTTRRRDCWRCPCTCGNSQLHNRRLSPPPRLSRLTARRWPLMALTSTMSGTSASSFTQGYPTAKRTSAREAMVRSMVTTNLARSTGLPARACVFRPLWPLLCATYLLYQSTCVHIRSDLGPWVSSTLSPFPFFALPTSSLARPVFPSLSLRSIYMDGHLLSISDRQVQVRTGWWQWSERCLRPAPARAHTPTCPECMTCPVLISDARS